MPGPPSHKADRAIAAYRLRDGNLVVFVSGRLQGVKGESNFSLLVPRADIDRMKAERAAVHETRVFPYLATIGPSSDYKAGVWSSIPTQRVRDDFDPYRIPASDEPIIYEMPESPELRKTWGDIELVYVEPYPDQSPFRIYVMPKAQHVKGQASKWLPLTPAADAATLPLQALWSALFLLQAPAR